jgi:hypothetical protein
MRRKRRAKRVKRGFVRVLWGIYDHQGRRFYKRRTKMDNDIKLLLKNQYSKPFMTYVFGEDNFKFLKDKGFNCKLVDKKPIVWNMDKEQFRHKLEAFRLGMQDYDEIVFLDWDCHPVAPLPRNFWKVLGQKDPFQAPLRMYHRRKATWRRGDQRKIPCASFVYFRDKQIPQDLVDLWEKLNRPWSEEIVMARYFDGLMDGWKGLDEYWDRFEPDFFYLDEGRVFTPEQLKSKNRCFRHFNSRAVGRQLRGIKKGNKQPWHK